MIIKKFNKFLLESKSNPVMKYPVDKCFDFLSFDLELRKDGIYISSIPIKGEKKNGTVKDVYDEMYGQGTWEDDFQKYNERLVEWSRPTYDFMMRADLSTKL